MRDAFEQPRRGRTVRQPHFTGFREIAERFPSNDAALLPIGAYEPGWFMLRQHMDPEQALRAFEDLGGRTFVAMHWGTFTRAGRRGGAAAEAGQDAASRGSRAGTHGERVAEVSSETARSRCSGAAGERRS